MNIENFRGDFNRVAALVQQAWAGNEKQSQYYTAEFLASLFEYPGAGFSLAPTLYNGAEPIAFIAGFPRRVSIKRKEYTIVVSSFLSVSNEFKRRGYGILLWSELVRRARATGFDGMMNYCIEGEPMNDMILGSCRLLKIPVERIFSVRYLSSVLWAKKPDDGVVIADGGIVDTFMDLAVPLADHVPFSRIWSRPEVEWQCARRLGSIAVRHVNGRRRGLLSGYVIEIADPKRTKCLLVEDILWGDLKFDDRKVLVQILKSRAASSGARLAVVPVQGYSDMSPFVDTGFRPSTRIVHAYFSLWSGRLDSGRLDAIYLDVF